MISKGYVINPYYELLPDYKICPFSNKDIFINRSLLYNNRIDDYFSSKFQNSIYRYTINGREAIRLALKSYNLNISDVVTILTTSGNYYISNCVTKEIENICKWSRVISPATKLIFVNHEFGFPYQNLTDLKKYNLPIIEDCAHTFFSEDIDNNIGTIGDFTIYSFPKMFPIQIGGLLVSNLKYKTHQEELLGQKEKRYIKNVLSHYIQYKEEIIKKRKNNYSYLSKGFKSLDLMEHFCIEEGITPGVFMFKKSITAIDLTKLKIYFYSHGIQCSIFYGEESFFLPVHQALNEPDLDYFIEVMKSFIKKTT